MNFVGLNADLFALGNPGNFADAIKKLNSRAHVLINDAKRALEFAQALPQTTFIDREWHPEDGNWWRVLTPEQMMDRFASRPGRGVLVRYILNEPGIANDERDVVDPVRREVERARIRQFVAWCVEVLDRAAAIGEKVIIWNAWAGTPHQYWIEEGEFDPLIRALDRYRDLHMLGLHEGSPFMVAGKAAIGLDYEAMKDPAKVQREQWGDPAAFPLAYQTDGSLPPYWMVGRCIWLGLRAIKIGVRPPRIGITEFTAAINEQAGALDLYRVLNNGGDPRQLDGFPSLVPAYTRYFSDPNDDANVIAYAPASVIHDQLSWDAGLLPENVEFVALFAHNYGEKWRLFNVDQVWGLYRLLQLNSIPLPTRTYATAPGPAPVPTPIPPPAPVPPSAYTVTTDLLNVREMPSLTAKVLTTVRRGTRLNKRVDAWKPVMLPDGRAGWVHGDYVE